MQPRTLAAWLVHLYTASGGVVGMFALFAAAEGRIHDAFLLLLLTSLIDATDGILARLVRVRDVLPSFDGAMVDNVIAVLMIVVPAVLTFIPTRYLYASKNRILWKTTWSLGALWMIMVVVGLSQDSPSRALLWASLFYPAYYMLASFTVDWRVRRGTLRMAG